MPRISNQELKKVSTKIADTRPIGNSQVCTPCPNSNLLHFDITLLFSIKYFPNIAPAF